MKTDNELIAEFMGWEGNRYPHLPNIMHRGIGPYERGSHKDHFKYDTSWDELMPVVQKTFDTEFGNDFDQWAKLNGKIHEALATVTIEYVHSAVVNFIKWHNSL